MSADMWPVGLGSPSTLSRVSMAPNGGCPWQFRRFLLSSAPSASSSCQNLHVGVSVSHSPHRLYTELLVISRDRSEEALEIVKKLHQDPSDPDNIFAFREYQQIRQQFEIDRRSAVSWTQMFTKSSYRKRMIIGFIVLFGSQTTATTVIASKTLTITHTRNRYANPSPRLRP